MAHPRRRFAALPPMSATLAPAPAPADAPIALSRRDFDRIRRLILDRAGISLHDGKHAMVHGRLTRRMRATGHRSFDDYLCALERSADAPEWQSFVNSLTTNLTAFFREEHHFTALADDLRARGRRPTRIWCNAASTGEEPYSIAMVVDEVLGPDAPVSLRGCAATSSAAPGRMPAECVSSRRWRGASSSGRST